MLIQTVSVPLNKALLLGNSQAPSFSTAVNMTGSEPMGVISTAAPHGDGMSNAGHGGAIAPNRVFLVPYAEGGSGLRFSLRLYGWRPLYYPGGDPNKLVWIPYLLVELACVTCTQSGPPATPPGPSQRLISDTEFACDTITLTRGSLGVDGFLCSTGPGSNLIAFALVDLSGSKKISFDFAQTDNVSMNCLFARA